MKRIITLALACLMVVALIGLTACGTQSNNNVYTQTSYPVGDIPTIDPVNAGATEYSKKAPQDNIEMQEEPQDDIALEERWEEGRRTHEAKKQAFEDAVKLPQIEKQTYEAAKRVLEAARQKYDLAKQELDLAEQRYEDGEISKEEFFDTMEDFFNGPHKEYFAAQEEFFEGPHREYFELQQKCLGN